MWGHSSGHHSPPSETIALYGVAPQPPAYKIVAASYPMTPADQGIGVNGPNAATDITLPALNTVPVGFKAGVVALAIAGGGTVTVKTGDGSTINGIAGAVGQALTVFQAFTVISDPARNQWVTSPY